MLDGDGADLVLSSHLLRCKLNFPSFAVVTIQAHTHTHTQNTHVCYVHYCSISGLFSLAQMSPNSCVKHGADKSLDL